ncbi:MAG: CsgG/HfaB family protein [Rivularia sp. ALOHA_DT_140]|nr:CsgG/HfaB family protein [Rivularia sp. ALOHA_DT_140]
MMNCYFVRRVTSYIFAPLISLSIGINHIKIVNAEDTKRLNFCQHNKSLFHLDKNSERKVRIAVIDADVDAPNHSGHTLQPSIQFKGVGNILANKLAKNNNFRVVNWSQIKPEQQNRSYPGQPSIASQDTISLKKLRELRDKYGIEAVLIGTINSFEADSSYGKQFLGFGTSKKKNEVQVNLNFRVVDTTTGDIILPAEGVGSGKKFHNTVKVPNIYVTVKKHNDRELDISTTEWNKKVRGSTIEFNFLGNNSQDIISATSTKVFPKLLAIAVENAINQVAKNLNSRSSELACLLRKPTLIADVDENNRNQVIINKGKLHGYCKGMKFSVERYIKSIIDPATGRVIRIKTENVGEVVLNEVDSQSSLGTGSTKFGKFFRRRDIAKLIKSDCKNQSNQSNSDSSTKKVSPSHRSIEFNSDYSNNNYENSN